MVKKLYYILDRKQKINFIILGIIIILGSFTELGGVALIAPLVTLITNEDVIHTDSNYKMIGEILGLNDVKQYVIVFLIGIILIYIFKNLYLLLQNYVQYRYIYNNQRKITTKLMVFYMQKDYLYHVDTNVADISRNIISDVNSMFDALLNVFYVFNEALVGILLVTFLAIQDWKSTVSMAIILTVFMGFFILFYRRYSVKLGEKARVASAKQSKWILQGFGGIKEIKVTGKENYFSNQYDRASLENTTLMRKKAFVNVAPKSVMEVVCIDGLLFIILVRILGGEQLSDFLPILSIFAVAAFRMIPSFNRITAYVGTVLFGKPAVNHVYNDIKEMRENEENVRLEIEDKFEFSMKTDIELKEVTFRYPEGEDNVLENISLTIPHMKSVALIGASGAGKSTLADIILGILKPQSGVIEGDGVNILEHLRPWHKKIGYIPQVIYLMDDSIRANIAFGLEPDEIDDDKIWKALKDAQLEEFIKELPDGLDTVVGDRGVRLSGGQRQRIGIARALYNQPEFLVLDEATSALDNDTEKAVMEAIDSLHGSRTMLIIAHRLSTIRNCDFVYEVGNKTVVLKDKEEING